MDDDEMLPQRIEVARHSSYAFLIVTSRFIAHTLKGDFVWPRRLMTSSEELSEYLFTRNSFFGTPAPGSQGGSSGGERRAREHKVVASSELPRVKWQRCVAYFQRNVLAREPAQAMAEVVRRT